MNESLHEYNKKRQLAESTEPRDDSKAAKSLHQKYGEPLFVIQEHAASSHHFDLRLEIEGVLKSWAVPKGPATDPSEKRLAVATEDHPIAYASFEGIIPEGQYGAGPVIVWDIGKFKNLKEDTLQQQYDDGHIAVELNGRKITGGYTLIQTKFNNDAANWVLVKIDDEAADARRNPVNTEQQSVMSGKTIAEM